MMIGRKARFTRDISNKEGSIGNVFCKHRNELMSCTSSAQLKTLVDKLFVDNAINTPKSRQISFNLAAKPHPYGLMYVQNIIFASKGMATY